MIVVADTSPITNLLLIGKLGLLSQIYGRVIIPLEVKAEIFALANFGYDIQHFTDAKWIETIQVAETNTALSLLLIWIKGRQKRFPWPRNLMLTGC